MGPHGQPSSSLLKSGSLSLKPLSSWLEGSLLRCVTVLVSTALPCWSMVKGASSGIGSASAAVDRIVLLDESWDEVCWLKPVTTNECCCSGLIVKSSIFPKRPMLLMSWASWLQSFWLGTGPIDLIQARFRASLRGSWIILPAPERHRGASTSVNQGPLVSDGCAS